MAVLADAALTEQERQVLEHYVAAVQAEYGDDLDAIWLYGSRARGERLNDESDIDLLVVARKEHGDLALYRLVHETLDALGNPWVLLEPRERTREWIDGRRAIESFFLRDVDRDKIVLVGDP
jgi:predicted nucleotidyltransferase